MRGLDGRRRGRAGWKGFVIVVGCFLALMWSQRNKKRSGPPAAASSASAARVDRVSGESVAKRLAAAAPSTSEARREGIGAILLVDTSGSMKDNVPDADGRPRMKLDIARRCVVSVVKQAEGFAAERSDRPVLLGLFEFSGNAGGNAARELIKPSKPDVSAAQRVVIRMKPQNGTPIGEAMIKGKVELDKTRLSKLHLLVVTDGENSSGVSPETVMSEISKLPEEQRP